MSSDNAGAAGASAARNKLATFMRECGVRVQASYPDCPPKDIDFFEAISVAMRRLEFEGLSRDKLVKFEWGQNRFEVPVPSQVIQEIEQRGLQRYELFGMNSFGGNSHFYLALGTDGKASVFRFKRWSGKSDEYETEIA